MSKLGFKSVVYHGDVHLGEVEAVEVKLQGFRFPNDEIRIHHLVNSERCFPLSIMQTICPSSFRCKLESSAVNEQPNLINLHAVCFQEFKTAVVLLGEEEIHLVAMRSRQKNIPCFWCYSVPSGLYNICLGMLNLRCLSIVFDLDETLIVANSLKSFDDKIEVLKAWIVREIDPVRASGMSAELKRMKDDRALLKQYADTDSVTDNGKIFKVELEEVFPVADGREKLVRPVVRLPEKNIVLTRINPEIRDTSVLVRLRPAWEDLRSYLTAKGRKRFEVFVCTMAERDYALEMWRLLDPESRLINLKQLKERITCVKSGARKSLLNVFQVGNCHPKMAMVIDDRLKVWEDKDQPRVHVVPAFTPYHAPQGETAHAVPVLCVARNVACNVRAGFFKEFDEHFLRKIGEVHYEDEVVNLPSAPDVSNYLMSEDGSFGPNSNMNAPINEGMHGPEVAQRLGHMDENNGIDQETQSRKSNLDRRSEVQQPVANVPGVVDPSLSRQVLPSQKLSLLGDPYRRDSSSSGLDSDRRKSLIVNPSQDTRYRGSGDPVLLSRYPSHLPIPSVQPQGGWLIEEDTKNGPANNKDVGVAQVSSSPQMDRQQPRKIQPYNSIPGSTPTGLGANISEVKGEEAYPGKEALRQNAPIASQPSGVDIGMPPRQASSNGRESQNDGVKMNNLQSSLSIGVLHEIGRRCSSKVEFRSISSTSKDLQFSIEVLFTGERIGVGMGKTRKDAQQQAAENALRKLADKYVEYVGPCSGAVNRDFDELSLRSENGFLWDNSESDEQPGDDGLPMENNYKVLGNASAKVENQQVCKRANSPRSSQSVPSNKRLKG